MKAIVRDEYGSPDVLRFEDIDKPIPGPDQVLVEVRSASVNTADLDQLHGTPRIARLGTGLGRPNSRRLGLDVAGVVEAVGRDVTRFAPGDAVWADLFSSGAGAFADYVCARERGLHHKPPELTFDEAASLPHSASLALMSLSSRGGVRAGQRVLINGAGGCVGPFAVQIAKSMGAHVTGVDHGDKLDLVLSVGADEVIDYTKQDFTKSGHRYDRIVDIAAKRTLLTHRRALAPGGVYVQIARTLGGFFRAAVFGLVLGLGTDKRMGVFMWEPNRKRDLDQLAELVTSGRLRPVIDRRYSLADAPEALRRHADGLARGKLVINP